MAIGGPSGNNLFDLSKLFKNDGVAPNNQTEKVSSTETETPIDTASKSAGRIAQLRAEALGDVFGTVVGANAVAKTAGASPINLTKLDKTPGITEVSALGKPSSLTAIDGPVFGGIAASGNFQIASENNSLWRAARSSQAAGLDDGGGFKGFTATANAELEGDNRLLLALVG
jgi:hypothetical protein